MALQQLFPAAAADILRPVHPGVLAQAQKMPRPIIVQGKSASGSRRGRCFFKELLFAVNQGIDVVRGQFKPVTVRDGIGRAGFHAIAAENAPRIINVVCGSITLASGNPIRVRVFRRLDVNAIGGAGRGAQKTPDALLESVFVAMQYVNSAIARLEMHRFVWVVLRHGFPKNIPEGHAETLHQRLERLTDFTNDGWHRAPV